MANVCVCYFANIINMDCAFQDVAMDGDDSGGSSVVASVPSALARWSEEARVLDGESIHDGITGTGCIN